MYWLYEGSTLNQEAFSKYVIYQISGEILFYDWENFQTSYTARGGFTEAIFAS